ncbi:nitrate ABC transporter substrate-binding protein [Mycolicibacterium agri]|uniref:Nitrate ABC transporter substrate-binding protein n=2 Tax=Mycolicibacterium agri TaxID=36811 RepID=A0A2A7N4V9_MYCAG|nr:nitrate ABC transporter substrate-binding protein [Mycolicibacterium agri]GFG53216.1 nitrate ABC transporter substrate-binding protein [Mycolicibacterium agri]
MNRILTPMTIVAVLAALLTGCASGGDESKKLVIAHQDNGLPALIDASGVLDGTPYKVEWAILAGPAANLTALYGKTIDVGHMGDTSLTIEQANANQPWTEQTAPLKIVAGWRNDFDPKYTPLVTAVRTSAGIDSLAGLRGRSWGYNFGGYNHAQYLVSLARAGLTESDIKPVKFNDGNAAAAAFNSGQVDVFSGSHAAILSSLTSGDAKILLSDRDTKIPALGVWTARTDVLADPDKDAALRDFFGRLSRFWEWYADNPDTVKQTLKSTLKLDDARTEFEYHVRSGSFRKLDDALVAEEQAVADELYRSGVVKKQVDVTVEYDPRYNDVQKAQGPQAPTVK